MQCVSSVSINRDLRAQLLRFADSIQGRIVEEDPFGQGFLERVASVTERTRRSRLKKIESALKIATGFTDLHYFVNTGLPGVGYGPSGEGGHAINERVHIPDLVRTSAIYATFMTRAEL